MTHCFEEFGESGSRNLMESEVLKARSKSVPRSSNLPFLSIMVAQGGWGNAYPKYFIVLVMSGRETPSKAWKPQRITKITNKSPQFWLLIVDWEPFPFLTMPIKRWCFVQYIGACLDSDWKCCMLLAKQTMCTWFPGYTSLSRVTHWSPRNLHIFIW